MATPSRILPDLSAANAAADRIAALEALVAKLTAAKAAGSGITCKVSAKGALSIYGLGRWPITLYLSQYQKLVAEWPKVEAFVEAHMAEFSTKE